MTPQYRTVVWAWVGAFTTAVANIARLLSGTGPYTLPGATLFFTFTADQSNTDTGFHALFSSVVASVTPSRSPTPSRAVGDCAAAGNGAQYGSGSVDFSSGYSNGMYCSYTFTATPGYIPVVSFDGSFDTETNYDFVRIYDTGNSTAIVSLSGNIDPGE